MRYKQLTINTTSEFSDLVALMLHEAGSQGVNIVDENEMRSILLSSHWDYVDEKLLSQCSPVVRVMGFFDEDYDISPIESELFAMRQTSEFEVGSLEIVSTIIDSAQWENVWKKYYKPIKINNISIVPLWLKNPHKNTLAVYINPGMAFGTGSHETTSMCIDFLTQIDLCGKMCGDIGCGSGILGICALKLGASGCVFVDTDKNAIAATKENCRHNNVEGTLVHASLLSECNQQFDVIVANLTADLLIQLYDELFSHLKSGGKIIISGIIKERAEQIKGIYQKNYNLVKQGASGEWCAYMMEKE